MYVSQLMKPNKEKRIENRNRDRHEKIHKLKKKIVSTFFNSLCLKMNNFLTSIVDFKTIIVNLFMFVS